MILYFFDLQRKCTFFFHFLKMFLPKIRNILKMFSPKIRNILKMYLPKIRNILKMFSPKISENTEMFSFKLSENTEMFANYICPAICIGLKMSLLSISRKFGQNSNIVFYYETHRNHRITFLEFL